MRDSRSRFRASSASMRDSRSRFRASSASMRDSRSRFRASSASRRDSRSRDDASSRFSFPSRCESGRGAIFTRVDGDGPIAPASSGALERSAAPMTSPWEEDGSPARVSDGRGISAAPRTLLEFEFPRIVGDSYLMIISDQRSVCACESASRRQDAALSSSSPTLRTVVARGPWRLSEVRSPHLYARAETVSNSSHGLDGPPKGYRPVWRLPHPALVGAPRMGRRSGAPLRPAMRRV